MFDLDGTLVDSVPDLAVAVDNMLEQLGFAGAGEQRVRGWVGNGAAKLVQRALAFALSTGPAGGAAAGIESADGAPDDAAVNSALQIFLQFYQQCNGAYSRLYSGVSPALQHWQRHTIPMAIVTNKPLQFVPELLSRLGIEHYFSVLVGGECTARKKPSPQPLYYACRQLGVDPGACLMIGDSRNDVQAARSAAMPVVAVSYGYNHGEPIAWSQPDRVIDRLDELIL